MSDPILVAEDLRKSFDEPVLEGVDLAVDRGETLALMGANGAGKSVLLSCLAGSERPSSGSVEVLGRSVSDGGGATSLLLQDSLCLDRLSGRENLAFYDRADPRFTDRWREYVDRFDLADDLGRSVEDYSGGMKRKLELSVALSVDAPVYLLDEPTAALDLSTIRDVHALVDEHRESAATFVVATHLPMDAEIADRIAFLAGGRIAAEGTPDELLDSLPPVIETAAANASELRESAVDGRVFQIDDVARGFLPPETDGDDELGDETDVVEPSYTDMFNYYTQVSSS